MIDEKLKSASCINYSIHPEILQASRSVTMIVVIKLRELVNLIMSMLRKKIEELIAMINLAQ